MRGDRLQRVRFRWGLANPLLRNLVQAGALAGVVIAGFAGLRLGDRIDATSASVLVAVIFGAATVLQLRQAQRRQYTVELLTNFQTTEALAAADMWMAARIADHREVPSDLPADELRYAMAMLDYYEFLATLALRGFIDVSMLRSLRGGTMSRCHDLCRTYIAGCRAEIGGELYRCFELFVEEHRRRGEVWARKP
jgi:hypothetical protein